MEVSFPSADKSFDIYGNLTLPDADDPDISKPVPAILIIAGSGPIDRDGNVPGWIQGMKLNTSNRFVDYIVSSKRRIAVLSYDKRGVGKSLKTSDSNLYYRAGMYDLVSDAVQAIKFLANHPRIDPTSITLWGHSEGAITAPLICKQVLEEEDESLKSPIKGCIFLGGFGETIDGAMKLQREQVVNEVNQETGLKGWFLKQMISKEKIEKQYNDYMEQVNAEEKPEFVSNYCGIAKMPAKWMREQLAWDAQAMLAEHIVCHCLAITGCKDAQVRNEFCLPDRAKEMVPKAASIESHRPTNLTHILRSMEGPPKMLSLKEEYARMSQLPLDPELLALIGDWCDRIILRSKQS